MGLALGLTLAQVRALPYAEFRAWQMFYLLEPWGWHDEEYRTASVLTMLYNANRGKGKPRKLTDFMRKMATAVLNELQQPPDLSQMSRDEIVAMVKKDFGIK